VHLVRDTFSATGSRAELIMARDGRRLVLGIGNPERGDDASGRVVARLLRGKLPAGFEIVEVDGEATALLAQLEDAQEAFLVDACVSGAPAGTIRRFDVSAGPLPPGKFGLSTHSFGLKEALELARTLGSLPPRCIVYAIEGQSFELGEPLSPQVAAAATNVAARLRGELRGEEGA